MSFVPPAVVTPLSAFENPEAVPEEPVTGLLADAIDPQTGEYLSIERGVDPTDAALLFALRVKRGSGSAVEDVGHRFDRITHIAPALDVTVREEVRLALQHLIDDRQIRLDRVTIVTEGDSAEAQIVYSNLPRRAERRVALPLTELLPRAS